MCQVQKLYMSCALVRLSGVLSSLDTYVNVYRKQGLQNMWPLMNCCPWSIVHSHPCVQSWVHIMAIKTGLSLLNTTKEKFSFW